MMLSNSRKRKAVVRAARKQPSYVSAFKNKRLSAWKRAEAFAAVRHHAILWADLPEWFFRTNLMSRRDMGIDAVNFVTMTAIQVKYTQKLKMSDIATFSNLSQALGFKHNIIVTTPWTVFSRDLDWLVAKNPVLWKVDRSVEMNKEGFTVTSPYFQAGMIRSWSFPTDDLKKRRCAGCLGP
jgi:hypothetical protein